MNSYDVSGGIILKSYKAKQECHGNVSDDVAFNSFNNDAFERDNDVENPIIRDPQEPRHNVTENGHGYGISLNESDVILSKQSTLRSFDNIAFHSERYNQTVETENSEQQTEGNISENTQKCTDIVEEKDVTLDRAQITNTDLPIIFKASLIIGNCFLATLPFGFQVGLAVLFVPIMDEFKATRVEVMPIISVFTGLVFAGGGVIGPLINRFNAGKVSLIAAVLASTGCMICWFAQSIVVLVLGIGVFAGIGLSVGFLVPLTIVGKIFEKNRVTMVTVVSIFIGIGMVYFPYLLAALVDEFGWRGALLIVGAIFLNCIPIAVLNTIYIHKYESKRDVGKSILNLSLFCKPDFLAIAFTCLMINTLFPTLNIFFIDMMRSRQFDVDDGPFLLSAYGFSSIAGRVLLTFLSPFCKVRRFTIWPLYIALTSLSISMFIFVQTYEQLLAVCIGFGFGWGTCAVSYPAVIMEVSGLEMFPTALGYINFMGGMAGFSGGPIAGIIKDKTQSYDLVYILSASLGLSSCVLIIVVNIVQKSCTRSKTKSEEKQESIEL